MPEDPPDQSEPVVASRTAFSQPQGPRVIRNPPPVIPEIVPPSLNPNLWERTQNPHDTVPLPLTTSTDSEPKRPRANFAEISVRLGHALSGLIGILFNGVSLARSLQKRDMPIRQPTQDEADAVAEPLGRIIARHAPVDLASDLINDLFDAGEAFGGTVRFIQNSRPYTEHVPTQSQMEGTAR